MHQTVIAKLLPSAFATGVQPSILLLAAMALALGCGLLAFLLKNVKGLSEMIGFWGVVSSAAVAFPAAALGLSRAFIQGPETFPWQLPLGIFTIGIDSLSAIFLLPLLMLGPLAALHSRGYLKGHGEGFSDGVYWLFFNMLFASMILVLCACDGLLFMIAWELMGVSSFALVAFNHNYEATRSAAWKYLVASHLGAACLLAMFVLLSPDPVSSPEETGVWLWSSFAEGFNFQTLSMTERDAAFAVAAFILALVGFGLKAGFVPLHVWLPEAHPAAPAPVSALMSGIMIKLGLYGILRVTALVGSPCSWQGWAFLAIGAATGIYGAICALSQSDLKRLLAYSSVENVGIVSIGLGIGVLGMANEQFAIGLIGFAGAFIHILNHSAMKGLLFLCAGSVFKGAGTLELDKLGGLMKRMPWTGTSFVVGAAAISGLPPFNGFIGEFLIALAAFEGLLTGDIAVLVPSIAALGSLAVIGGLAPAVFAKATGACFLGEPKSEGAANAKEQPLPMLFAQCVLAFLCLALSIIAPRIVAASVPAISTTSGTPDWELANGAFLAFGPLFTLGIISSGLLVLLAVFALFRGALPRANVERTAVTWDCGYAAPTAKMQYTGSSLAQPLRDVFRFLFRPVEKLGGAAGPFPTPGVYSSSLPDLANRWLVEPLFKSASWLCGKLHALQSGHLHLYILMTMIALTLMLLWAWTKLGGAAQ